MIRGRSSIRPCLWGTLLVVVFLPSQVRGRRTKGKSASSLMVSTTASPNTRRNDTLLTEGEIRRALHADRVVPLGVANSHDPLGLEQLAGAVAAHRKATLSGRIRRPIDLPVKTWEKPQALAAAMSKGGAPRITADEVAATIIEQHVLDAGW
jgi:hypothetical protein